MADNVKRALMLAKSGRLSELISSTRKTQGKAQGERLARAADLTNLERFSDPALHEMLSKGLIAIDKPSKFNELTPPLDADDFGPYRNWYNVPDWEKQVEKYGPKRSGYLQYLKDRGPLSGVPQLQITGPHVIPERAAPADVKRMKKNPAYKMPRVFAHDGRHRALALGDEPTMPISVRPLQGSTIENLPPSAMVPKMLTLVGRNKDNTLWARQHFGADPEYVEPPEELFAKGGTVHHDVGSPERKQAFEQWGGEPERWYHGTSKDVDFSKFKVGRHGAWFTRNPATASMYAEQNDSQGYKHGHDETGRLTFLRTNTRSRVIPVHLKFGKTHTGQLPDDVMGATNYKRAQSDWFDRLRAQGYDSWVPEGGDVAVILKNPANIKSAIGNRGTFDPNDPDIAKAHGGATTKGARRALMIARDQQALLRRVANIYPGPRGGMDPSPGGGGYAGPGGGQYIGPSNYADGGKIPPFKLHSGAAKLIAQKGQAKATPQQYAAMPGIKPDELKHAKFDELGNKALPKEQVLEHLEANKVPLQETVLGGSDFNYGEEDDTRFHEWQLPGGNNYREVVLHLPRNFDDPKEVALKKARDNAEEQLKQAHAAFKQRRETLGAPDLPNSHPSLRPEYDALNAAFNAFNDKDFKYQQNVRKENSRNFRHEQHWPGIDNPVAHLRMSDRKGPNGEKVLHVEEVQSDWGQKGREEGFQNPQVEARRTELLKQARETRKQHEEAINDIHKSRREYTRGFLRQADPDFAALEKWFDTTKQNQSDVDEYNRRYAKLFEPYKEGIAKIEAEHQKMLADQYARYTQKSDALHKELSALPEKGAHPSGPYVDNTQKWTDLALKRVLHEAAHGGYDKVVFTPGDEQADRYDLSKHINRIAYDKENERLLAYDHNFRQVMDEDVPHDVKEFAKHIGKEPAEKLDAAIKAHEYDKDQWTPYKDEETGRWHISDPNGEDMYDYDGEHLAFRREHDAREHINRILKEDLERAGSGYPEISGLDLKVGGQGMRGYYDNILPKRLQALAQQHDPQAKVQLGAAPMVENAAPLHSLDVTPQMRDSIKQNGFNQFKRGGDVGMRQRYADGGGADNPVVNKALDLVSMFQPAKPTMAQRVAPLSGEPTAPGSVSIKSLSEAFDRAIQHHTSLGPEDRAANSRAALQKIAPYLGKSKTGVPSPLLTKNAKLMKSEAGYKGGDPISLPNGQGVETTGLALAPAYQEGKFTTCPNSASCKKECLGKFAGGYFYAGGGQDPDALKGPRLNSVRKTQAMLREPEAFAVRLHDEIEAAKRMASINNNMLGVRLNVLSDINPRVHKAIIDAHPDVAFYDYTKNNTNPVAPNHHYTYSSTGVSDTDVDNPHSNWKQMRKRLDTGSNVAMAFSHKAHLPETVFDEETGKRYRVVNGDSHDFRPLDIQPKGQPGVIVGLRNKKISSTNEAAHRTSNGFFVKYNPDFLVGNKGKRVKDMHGNPIAQNTEVRIRHQKQAPTLKSNDEAETP